MKKILCFIVAFNAMCWSAFGALSAAQIKDGIWENGSTLFGFFDKFDIPTSVYYDLPPEDRELTGEIYAGVRYYTSLDDDGNLLQALIPIGDGMQIHIFKHKGEYRLDFTPIAYFKTTQEIVLAIQNSPYQDLIEVTDDMGLVSEFLNAYKNSVNFNRGVLKGDRLALIYERKYRLGKPFGNVQINAAMVETNKKPNYIFSFNNGKYYDAQGREVQGFALFTPVSGARISSKFSLGRKHPILGIVRPHYGVDYAAPKGTAVSAAAGGKVVFAGRKGGYGNVVEIAHANGLKTLYAHLNSIANGMKSGKSVKKGQLIGRVGSTGLSTGPHLHFGVYKNNRPINPLGSIKTQSKELDEKAKIEFLAQAEELKDKITQIVVKSENLQDNGSDLKSASK